VFWKHQCTKYQIQRRFGGELILEVKKGDGQNYICYLDKFKNILVKPKRNNVKRKKILFYRKRRGRVY